MRKIKIGLTIEGTQEMIVYYLTGRQVGIGDDNDILQGILDNLEMGEYVINLQCGLIFDINDFENAIYKFELQGEYVEFNYSEYE